METFEINGIITDISDIIKIKKKNIVQWVTIKTKQNKSYSVKLTGTAINVMSNFCIGDNVSFTTNMVAKTISGTFSK